MKFKKDLKELGFRDVAWDDDDELARLAKWLNKKYNSKGHTVPVLRKVFLKDDTVNMIRFNEDDKLVGFVRYTYPITKAGIKDTLYLDDVVSSQYGLGAVVMGTIKEQGVPVTLLPYGKGNKAWYLSIGFKKIPGSQYLLFTPN